MPDPTDLSAWGAFLSSGSVGPEGQDSPIVNDREDNPNYLPGLGQVSGGTQLSPITERLTSSFTTGGPIYLADKAAQLLGAPEGAVAHLATSAGMGAVDWIPGLLEEAGTLRRKIPFLGAIDDEPLIEPGTIKRLQEEVENEKVSIMAHLGESTNGARGDVPAGAYGLASGLFGVGGAALPMGVAGRIGRLAGGLKGKVAGTLAEGALGFFGSTAGRTSEERLAAATDPRLLAAMAVGVGGESYAARQFSKSVRADAPKALGAVALDEPTRALIRGDDILSELDQLRSAATDKKLELRGEKIRLATEAISDPLDDLLTASLENADSAIAKETSALDELSSRSMEIADEAVKKLQDLDPEHTISTIKFASDLDEFSAISRTAEKMADALLDGDVTKLGSQEAFGAEREAMVSRLDEGRAARSAELALAEDPLADLRAVRERAAARAGFNSSRFDEVDSAYRAVEPDEPPAIRSFADALSEYRDLISAVTPRVRNLSGRLYDKMVNRGKTPVDGATGLPMARDEFAERLTIEKQQRMNSDLRGLLLDSDTLPPSETLRLLDTKYDALLKKYRISPEDVGFRGRLRTRQQMALNEANEWLSRESADRRLHQVSDEELVALGRKAAQDDRVPLAVFDFLGAERARRVSGGSPGLTSPAYRIDSPDDVERMIRESVPESEADALIGPKLMTRGTTFASKLKWDAVRLFGRLKGEAAWDIKVGRSTYGVPLRGVFLSDMATPLAEPRVRDSLVGMLRSVPEKSRAAAHEPIYSVAVALKDLDNEVVKFVAAEREAGRVVDPNVLYRTIKEAYETGQAASLPEGISKAITERADPELRKLSKFVRENTDDPELIAAIDANEGRYLYRYYNIFFDNQAIFKKLRTDSVAYKGLYDSVAKENYADISERLYREREPELRGRFPQEQIAPLIDKMVQQELHGMTEFLVKKHLVTPGSRPNLGKVVGNLPEQDYLIKRVLDDPNLRELLGEEKHFALAEMMTVEKISTDIGRMVLHRELLSALKAHGLASDTPRPGLSSQISPSTLKEVALNDPLSTGKPLYIHPEAAHVLSVLSTTGDSIFRNLNLMNSWVKLNLVATPWNYASQLVGVPQMVLLGANASGFVRALYKDPEFANTMPAAAAWQVAKEIIDPGTAGKFSSAKAEKFFQSIGSGDMDFVRKEAAWLDRARLDVGNELVFEAELAAKPLLHGSITPQTRKTRGIAGRGAHKAADILRKPDLAAKYIIYRGIYADSLWKEGIKFESGRHLYEGREVPVAEIDALKREAVKRTLLFAQDPRTTPAFLREMSHDARSLLFAGFHGFIYQMTRAYANSYRFALKDAAHGSMLGKEAMRLEALGKTEDAVRLRAKARRYGESAVERVVSSSLAAYVFPKLLVSGFSALYPLYEDAYAKAKEVVTGKKEDVGTVIPGDENERGEAARRFLWDDKTNARIIAPRLRKVGGRKKLLVIDGGRMDILDNTTKIMRAASTPVEDPWERLLPVTTEIRNQYLSNGFWVDALASVDIPKRSEIVSWEGAAAIGKGGLAAAGRLVNPFARNVAGFVTDSDSERLSKGFKMATGAWVRELDVYEEVGKRFDRDWRSADGWRSKMRDEWKAARSYEARNAVKKKYEDDWNNLMAELMVTHGEARRMGEMSNGEVIRALGDERTSKSTGKSYSTPIPKYIRDVIGRGRAVRLNTYLNEIERD